MNVSDSRSFPHSWLITWFATRLTLPVSLVKQELPTFPEHLSSPTFWWSSRYSIFSFICMFCGSLFVLLYFFFWSLCCLFFFDIRILITPLASSNSSFNYITNQVKLTHNICHIVALLLFYVTIVACCFISPLCCGVVVLFHLCVVPL